MFRRVLIVGVIGTCCIAVAPSSASGAPSSGSREKVIRRCSGLLLAADAFVSGYTSLIGTATGVDEGALGVVMTAVQAGTELQPGLHDVDTVLDVVRPARSAFVNADSRACRRAMKATSLGEGRVSTASRCVGSLLLAWNLLGRFDDQWGATRPGLFGVWMDALKAPDTSGAVAAAAELTQSTNVAHDEMRFYSEDASRCLAAIRTASP
jgi:hypothetical protein